MRALAALVLLLVAACDDMSVQPKQRAYSPSAAPVSPLADTVEFDSRVPQAPVLTAALVARGQERYRIYCAPCHAETGDGTGMIVARGFPAPESFHTERLRQTSTAHIYEVISNGQGAMYSFAARVPMEDRWAIAAYIRALQLSEHVPADRLAPEQRQAIP